MSLTTASKLVENPIDFDPASESCSMPEQTHAKPLTEREALIAKVTHPPSTVPEFSGLPTQDARTQVVFNFRNIDVLKTPIVFDRTTGKLVSKEWSAASDYSIVVPTGARIKWFGCTYDMNATTPGFYEQDLNNVGIQDNFNFKNWAETVNLYRPVAKSVTLYANVTAFNNQGIISCQQFNPNILFSGAAALLSHQDSKLFHHLLDSHFERDPEFVSNRDNVHPDFNLSTVEAWFKSRKIKATNIKLDPNFPIQIINMGTVGYESDTASYVPTPSQMAQNSMRSYQDKFVSGCFSVQRLNTISPEWLSGSAPITSADTIKGLYNCYICVIGNTGALSIIPLLDNSGVGNVPADFITMKDTLWTKDMTWTMIRMQGIAPNLVLGGDATVVSPVSIKTYYTIEAQPVWNGPWNGMSRVSPKPSLTDMQAIMDTFYEMPDGMPSKYNALGSFLPFLAQLVPHAIKAIGNLFSSKDNSKPAPRGPRPARKPAKKILNRENNLEKEVSKLRQQVKELNVAKTSTAPRPRRARRQNRRKANNRVPNTIIVERSKQ